MRWAVGGNLQNEGSKTHNSQPLLSFIRPEKSHFAVTYDLNSDDKVHAVQPFVGL